MQTRARRTEGQERVRELGRALEALLHVLHQAALDDLRETLRSVRAVLGERRRLRFEHERTHLSHRLAGERGAAGQELEQHDAERPEVRPVIYLARRTDLLG